MWKMIPGSLLCGVSLLGLVTGAPGLEMRECRYTQQFEETDPVAFWTSGGGTYRTNFKGLTDERAFSGGSAFKLDVTFTEGAEGGYFYWSIPVSVPAEGNLRFSGRILVGEETTASVGLGVNVCCPPTDLSICQPMDALLPMPFDTYGPTSNEWKLTERDLVEYGSKTADRVMALAWGATREHVGVYIDRIGLFVYGHKGQRVVVYIDDLELRGNVPAEDSYREEIRTRWGPAEARFIKEIESWQWRTTLQEGKDQLSSLNDLPPEAEQMKQDAAQEISCLEADLQRIENRGYMRSSEYQRMTPSLAALKNAISNIKLVSEAAMKRKAMLVYVVSPISSVKILPFDASVPGSLSREIQMAATPGEYEPASVVIRSVSGIDALTVAVTDLKGATGIIPSAMVDIKVVKCWYQSGSAWVDVHQQYRGNKVLVPELLLNDDSLVKVDHDKQANYLRLDFPEGGRYVGIDSPEDSTAFEILSVNAFPVRDSDHLLPITIPAGSNKQLWMTVAVPDSSEAGTYTGTIDLAAEGESLGSLALSLRVLPFRLAAPKRYDLKSDFESSIYYRGKLHRDYPEGSISSEYKSNRQLKSELHNMFIHGVSNPTVYQERDETLLGAYLRLREEVGMGGQPLYTTIRTLSPPAHIKAAVALAGSYGIPEVYFYGIDEAGGDKLASQRPAWEATHAAGGKVFVAGYPGSNFAAMGDIQDLLICAGVPSREEAEKWHSAGHKIWCYANPQGGVENPEIYRRNFGLLLYRHNYDGAATYAYQHAFGNIWNDFDSPDCRDLNLTYPTVDGVIDTIAWEGYREGIDDIRYATTLRLEIEKARHSGDRQLEDAALAAETYLETCDVERRGNLDAIRLEIINHIMHLTGLQM